jgi:hypothetical protein
MRLFISILLTTLVKLVYSQNVCNKDTVTSQGSISWNVGLPVTIYSNYNPSIDHVLTVSLLVTDIQRTELKNLTVFPNPVVNFLNINFSENINYTLYDNSGKYIQSNTGNIVNLENYPSGIYLLEIFQNNTKQKLQIIKQ